MKVREVPLTALQDTKSRLRSCVQSMTCVPASRVSILSIFPAHGAAAADPVTSYVAKQQRSRGCKKTAQKQERLCDNGYYILLDNDTLPGNLRFGGLYLWMFDR